MKKNITRLFTIIAVFFVFAIQTFAKAENNTISKIIIDSPSNNNYSLNLLFDKTYKGSAFLQKLDNGSYYVYLPDTVVNGKKPKIIFKRNYDKSRINLNIEEKTYIKDKKDSNYVRISVHMADDYTLKLVSGLVSEYKTGLFSNISFDIFTLIAAIMVGIAVFLIIKVLKKCENTSNTNYKPSRSYAYIKAQTDYLEEIKKESEQKIQRSILPKTSTVKNTLKQADKDSFDCFELPYAEDINNSNNYEFKSTLKQASKLLKEKPSLVKLRHTNPISKTNSTDVSGLQMPAVEDIIPKKEPIKRNNSQPNAELLSVLNITPNKGFYLTTVDDTLALFGFINENVFLFKKFKDLSQINLQARYYDKSGNNDIYIVRLDTYKAMIEISDTSMKELAKI